MQLEEKDWIECWGEEDGKLFVSKIFDGLYHFKFIYLH